LLDDMTKSYEAVDQTYSSQKIKSTGTSIQPTGIDFPQTLMSDYIDLLNGSYSYDNLSTLEPVEYLPLTQTTTLNDWTNLLISNDNNDDLPLLIPNDEGGHNIRTCISKDKCPLHVNKIIWKEVKGGLTVSQNGYKGKINVDDCYFEIKAKAKKIKQGDILKSSCNCARKGDEQCHEIAKSLGGPGNCINCMSCSKKMNIQMKSIENRVKNEGGNYIVTCDNKTDTKTITQIFKPYVGDPTTTIIIRFPTIHSEL
ncbi:14958_t:CDS:2, partial [Dentiscutata erythropus]